MSSEKATLEGLRIDRPNRPIKRNGSRFPTTAIVVVLVLAGVAAWVLTRSKATPVQSATVRTVSSGGEATLLNASGYVTARRSATVSSKVTGKVVEVMVEEGMKVEVDQILARLDSSNVQASLDLAKAQLESAKVAAEETRPNLEFAEKELQRFKELTVTKVVSDSDLRRAEAEARALHGRLARLSAEVGVAESQVDMWKQQVDDTIIRAPFGGIVTSKNAQPGEMISPMSVGGFTRTGICTIVDMGSLEIDVDVNESFINRVQPGRPVVATLDAYAEWQIPAKVIAIIPTADRQKATVKVRVGFDQLDPRILPDMGVKVAFKSSTSEKGQSLAPTLVVPSTAVQRVDGRDVVWVMKGGKVERRAVTTGRTDSGDTVIASGITAGERVVVTPPPGLTDGSSVSEQSR